MGGTLLYIQGKVLTITMLDQSYYDKTDEIIGLHGAKQASLISIIQDIQSEYRYLPPELLSYVAKKIGITEAKAYSVATFYENFSFEPKGKYVIKVCDGTACHVRKSTVILDKLRKELGLSGDKVTTDDMLFTLETVFFSGLDLPAENLADELIRFAKQKLPHGQLPQLKFLRPAAVGSGNAMLARLVQKKGLITY